MATAQNEALAQRESSQLTATPWTYGRARLPPTLQQCTQLVVGMVLDGDVSPVCSEIWPGNTADVNALGRVAQRFQERFRLRSAQSRNLRRSICGVVDRGMIARETIASIEDRGWHFILGAPHRNSTEIWETVLADPAPFARRWRCRGRGARPSDSMLRKST